MPLPETTLAQYSLYFGNHLIRPLIFTVFLLVGSVALAQTEVEERLVHPPAPISPSRERGDPPVIKTEEFLGIGSSDGELLEKESISLQKGGKEQPESRPVPLPLEKVQEPSSASTSILEQVAAFNGIYQYLYDYGKAIVGGTIAGSIMVYYFRLRRRMEYRSLLLALASSRG